MDLTDTSVKKLCMVPVTVVVKQELMVAKHCSDVGKFLTDMFSSSF